MPYEERVSINPETGKALFYDAARAEVQTQRDFSHFIGAAAGAFAGGHMGASSMAASNAVDHNFVFSLGTAAQGLAMLGIGGAGAAALTLGKSSARSSNYAEEIPGMAGSSLSDFLFGSTGDNGGSKGILSFGLTGSILDATGGSSCGGTSATATSSRSYDSSSRMDVLPEVVRWNSPGFLPTFDAGRPKAFITWIQDPLPTLLQTFPVDLGRLSKPLITPIPEMDWRDLILSTPDQSAELRRLTELGGFGIPDMPDMSILTRDDAFHILYGKPKPGAPDYIGRTRGYGDHRDPDIVDAALRARDRNHHMNGKGFGRAERIYISPEYDVVRGMEQIHIDTNGGAQSMRGTSSNAINAISEVNPKRGTYLDAARKSAGSE